ncbi:MAG: Nudix family hydrolase [Pseudomonadota bacterium]
MDAMKVVDVAAAVLLQPDGTFLLAQRPEGKPWAGYWEFPGGKIEPGESPRHALERELHEELGITVTAATPWITRVFAYPHATVRLHFFRVTGWVGTLHGRENQQFVWQRLPEVTVSPLLPANAPVLRALALPPVYAISHASELGEAVFLQRVEAALARGTRLIQLREKGWSREQMAGLARAVIAKARPYGAQVLLNADIELAQEVGADGVQLTGAQMAALTVRPDLPCCGASCHNAEELRRAAELGLDFALLSPVLPTLSHPGAAHLGWEKFAELVRDLPMPVYALGGLKAEDLVTAQQHGAHGIALLRQAW